MVPPALDEAADDAGVVSGPLLGPEDAAPVAIRTGRQGRELAAGQRALNLAPALDLPAFPQAARVPPGEVDFDKRPGGRCGLPVLIPSPSM